MAKDHRLGGLNNRNLFSHPSGDWKKELKVLTEARYGGSCL
jgi:hypothetical protein